MNKRQVAIILSAFVVVIVGCSGIGSLINAFTDDQGVEIILGLICGAIWGLVVANVAFVLWMRNR